MHLSIVIPAYNEEDRISSVVKSYTSYLNKASYDYEIIVICDGTDRTAGIIKEMMRTNNHLWLLEFKERQGKGGAIVEGFKAARGNVVGFVDSDESVNPDEFQKLVNMLGYGDCAIASRYAHGASILVPQPLKRRLASRVFNLLVNFMFGLGIKDTQCGAKVLRGEVVREVLPFLKLRGFEFDVELLWRIKQTGYSVKEVPVVWKHEGGSSFGLRNAPSMFLNLLRVKLTP